MRRALRCADGSIISVDGRRFGERLRTVRERRQLTQESVAGAVGVSRVAVTRWEAAQDVPRWESAVHLASALGVDVFFLLLGAQREEAILDALTPAIVPGEFLSPEGAASRLAAAWARAEQRRREEEERAAAARAAREERRRKLSDEARRREMERRQALDDWRQKMAHANARRAETLAARAAPVPLPRCVVCRTRPPVFLGHCAACCARGRLRAG